LSLATLTNIFDQIHLSASCAIVPAQRALDLRMPCMADQDAFAASLGVPDDFHMHLGDQRAGGVEDAQVARDASASSIASRHTVRAEHQGRTVGHIVQFFDEDGTPTLQILDHEAVVHDFMAHVDRCAEELERTIDDLDGAIDACAETAGIGE
jgi:hypothetical protein